MKIHLAKKWRSKLAALPESSMGAQHVDIFLKDGQVIRNAAVFNGEDCETDREFAQTDIQDIRLHED
jgi:hypothetical protein